MRSPVLGLTPEYRQTAFEAIIPSVRAGDFNLGMSSFTDTKEREAAADFVTYFRAGTLWAQRPGAAIDPDNACGLRVGVAYPLCRSPRSCLPRATTVWWPASPHQEGHLHPAGRSQRRTDGRGSRCHVGRFARHRVHHQNQRRTTRGRRCGVRLRTVRMAGGQDSGLAEPLRQALQHLIETGEYRTIATIWGVEKGMIDKPSINAAVR